MDDAFAPSSGHSASRIVHYVALKKRYRTFTGDITNAFLHVPEDDECYVDPLREWPPKRSELGLSLKVMWRLLKQLYGRRRAGTSWVDFMAALLLDCKLLRCEVAPQLFMEYHRGIFLEVHMDDLHGTGTERALANLKEELDKVAQFKVCAVHEPGSTYDRLEHSRTMHPVSRRLSATQSICRQCS